MSSAKKDTSKPKRDVAGMTADFIEKATGQKPLGLVTGTHPHIPSGTFQIDTLIGGTPLPDGKGMVCPGFPKQRITEVYGAESSGKTTLTLGAIVTVQKGGGVCMFLDFENALHHGYAKACGVDFNPAKLLMYAPNTLEEGLKMMYLGIKTGVELIVIDSVSAMVPKSELEKKLDDPAKIGALAAAMSTNLPKMVQWLKGSNTSIIFINQIRALIQAGARDTDNTSGGKAVKFYASLRLKLTRIRSDFFERPDTISLKKKKIPYGNVVQVKVVKNKLDGKQGQTGEIFIRYGRGVDEFMGLIESAVPRKVIGKRGSGYDYGGEVFRGKESLRKYLMANPKAFADIRDKITKALLSEAPEPLSGEDEIEDDEILSDLRKELGDDDILDSEGDEAPVEAVVEADAEAPEAS